MESLKISVVNVSLKTNLNALNIIGVGLLYPCVVPWPKKNSLIITGGKRNSPPSA
jgi:hypothetical protein